MRFLFTLFVYLFVTVAGTAVADNTTMTTELKKHHYVLSYDVYAGGMHALKATYETKADKGQYMTNVKTETNGFIGKMFPWSGEYKSVGKVKSGTLVPESHTSSSTWKDKTKKKSLTFKNGQIIGASETKDGQTKTRDNIDADLTQNASDLMTAALNAFGQIDGENGCNAEATAFDGKRTFKIKLTKGKMVSIRKSRYSSFNGPALKCVIEVAPVAGFREKDKKKGWMAIQNHSKDHGKAPQIWFAPLHDGGPFVPVRMQVSSDYGAAVGHLTAFSMPDLSTIQTAAGQ